MIIVMHPSATTEECAHLLTLLCRMIGNGHPLATIKRGEREVIALESTHQYAYQGILVGQAETMEQRIPIQAPYQPVSRAFKVTDSSLVVGERLGGQSAAIRDMRPVIIAGPCAVENREQVLTLALARP